MDCTPATHCAHGHAHGASVCQADLSRRKHSVRQTVPFSGADRESDEVEAAAAGRTNADSSPRALSKIKFWTNTYVHLVGGNEGTFSRMHRQRPRLTLGDASDTGLHDRDVIRDKRHWQLVIHSTAQRMESIEPRWEAAWAAHGQATGDRRPRTASADTCVAECPTGLVSCMEQT